MKKIIFALLPIFLVSACGDSEDTVESAGFNIECENQPDGWVDAADTHLDEDGNAYQISGEWYCKNQYLQTESDSDHIYGKLIVTKIGTLASDHSTAQYTFITRAPQPQHVIIQSIDSNENYTGEIQSLHTDFRFETKQKIFPQLLKMSSVRSSVDSDASADYAIEYDINNLQVSNLSKSRVSAIKDAI